jgi:hypothetical protein
MPHDERKRAELRSMGFTDDVMIDSALTRAQGDVESAVEMLFDGAITPNGTAGFESDSGGPVVSPHAFQQPTYCHSTSHLALLDQTRRLPCPPFCWMPGLSMVQC